MPWATPAGLGSCTCELPLAIPLIMAGVRVATVTTIGLVTVAAIIGGNRFGGLGQFITEGLQTNFDTKIYLGAIGSVVLAFLVDGALVGLQRSAHAVDPRTDGRELGHGAAAAVLRRSGQLVWQYRHPQPAPGTSRDRVAGGADGIGDRAAAWASTSATPAGFSSWASTSPTSAGPSPRTR